MDEVLLWMDDDGLTIFDAAAKIGVSVEAAMARHEALHHGFGR